MNIQSIDRSKLKSSEFERQKLLFLVNPMSYKLLARKQGQQIENLADIGELISDVQNGEKEFNFNLLRSKIRITTDQILTLKDTVNFI